MIRSPRLPLLAALALTFTLAGPGTATAAGINAGDREPSETLPFEIQEVARFDTPWALAFLPDGRFLVTEKPGRVFLIDDQGKKTALGGVPEVAASGQNGLLDVAVSPRFAETRHVYFTYVAPGNGGRLVLARARLDEGEHKPGLQGLEEIWRQRPSGGGGQPGGIIAFDPGGRFLFLTVGDRMRPESAQDPDQARGKILRLTLDGRPAPGNPEEARGGIRAETWTTGHRNPYGLAFAPDGTLWEHEMGPRGGDEFNRIEKGANYGWGEVSEGDNYSGKPIPRHATRPEFKAPPLYWDPVIAPAGLAFYDGPMFPQWKGSALIGSLSSMALVRVILDGKEGADEAERFQMEERIRDVAVSRDGAVWVIEDASPGRVLKLTPKR